jgi:hypothetical protein
VVLRAIPVELKQVAVIASPRLNETPQPALDKKRKADNIVSVMSGEEIRALPNANAAEAAARIPGVSAERDEGEGKFVQIRGTEPRLSNVTVDGVHVPGTEKGDRIAKLDDVPTDLLGAIEVTKTLTADMEADAIGGSVKLMTKIPEGAPRGYLSGQVGSRRCSMPDEDLVRALCAADRSISPYARIGDPGAARAGSGHCRGCDGAGSTRDRQPLQSHGQPSRTGSANCRAIPRCPRRITQLNRETGAYYSSAAFMASAMSSPAKAGVRMATATRPSAAIRSSSATSTCIMRSIASYS